MTSILEFLADPYLTEVQAKVLARREHRLILDRTVFYPGIGISPADTGAIVLSDGRTVLVRKSEWFASAQAVEHLCVDLPADVGAGTKVIGKIDWARRYAGMRVHTALHLVSVALPYPMIGGEIHDHMGSAIFAVDSTGLEVKGIEAIVRDLMRRNLPVDAHWVVPPLQDKRINIRSFGWPGFQRHVRAISIGLIDQQPCDGLHVRATAEVGEVEIVELQRIADNLYRCSLKVLR